MNPTVPTCFLDLMKIQGIADLAHDLQKRASWLINAGEDDTRRGLADIREPGTDEEVAILTAAIREEEKRPQPRSSRLKPIKAKLARLLNCSNNDARVSARNAASAVPAGPPPAPRESYLARIAREKREAAAAGGAAPPVLPRTKLKRAAVRIVEVPAKPLRVPACELYIHPKLGRIGLLTEIIAREEHLGKVASGHNREAHQERAEAMRGVLGGLTESVAEHGLKEPLKVLRGPLGDWLVVDGRHRLEACRRVIASKWTDPRREAMARNMERDGIPCVEISAEEVDGTILAALNNRHLSKQARALAALMVHPEVATEVHAGRKSPNDKGISQGDLATMVGVSIATMELACAFWREVSLPKHAKHRDEMLNQVFAGISFANVRVGALGKAATKGETRKPTQPAFLLFKAARSLGAQLSHYGELQRDHQVRFLTDLDAAIRSAPQEVRDHLAATLAAPAAEPAAEPRGARHARLAKEAIGF